MKVSSSLPLSREVLLDYTKLVTKVFKIYLRQSFGQYINNLLIDTHILELYRSLLYHIPYVKISYLYVL